MKLNKENKVPIHWAILIGIAMIIDGLVMILTFNWIKCGLSLKFSMLYAQKSFNKRKNGNTINKG